MRLLYSARSLDEVIYRDELAALGAPDGVDVRFTLTREWPDGLERGSRTDRPELLARGRVAAGRAAARLRLRAERLRRDGRGTLVELGHEPHRIRTERFGPS